MHIKIKLSLNMCDQTIKSYCSWLIEENSCLMSQITFPARQTDRHVQTDRQTGRQTDRQTDRQKGKQTNIHLFTFEAIFRAK